MKYQKNKADLREARLNENLRADVEKQKALTEYIAMMADVELENAEEEENYGA